MLATLYALFNMDLKILTTSVSADPIFSNIMNLVFFILTIEFLVFLIFEQNYIGSFIFYLDLLAVLSLIPDTDLIMRALTDTHSEASTAEHLIKASHSSQAGAR